MPRFIYSKYDDAKGGKAWSAGDDAELTNEVECGSTLRRAAEMRCRSDSLWDVSERAGSA